MCRRKKALEGADKIFRQIQNMAAKIRDDAAARLSRELPFEWRLRIGAARVEISCAEFQNIAYGTFLDELLGA